MRHPELQMQQQPQNQSTSTSTTAVVSSSVPMRQSQPHESESTTPRERVGHPPEGAAFAGGLARAAAYSANRGLTVAMRSSTYRAIRGTAAEGAEIAGTYAVPALVVGSTAHAIWNSASEAYNGTCH